MVSVCMEDGGGGGGNTKDSLGWAEGAGSNDQEGPRFRECARQGTAREKSNR